MIRPTGPFYILTQPDGVSSATTPIDVQFGIQGTLSTNQPLLGTAEEPIVSIDSGTLNLESTLAIDLSRVATDPELGGKLRLDNFNELASARIGFAGDPLDSFQAIVAASLSVPGIKEASGVDDNAPNAVIPLVGGVNKTG